MITDTIKAWHEIVQTRDATRLENLISDDAMFHSPVIYTPQQGKDLTVWYLLGAMHVLLNDSFRYTRTIVGKNDAALEFVTRVEGIEINGVDLITWGGDGKIKDFKVMLRPIRAINLVRQKMVAFLESAKEDQEKEFESF